MINDPVLAALAETRWFRRRRAFRRLTVEQQLEYLLAAYGTRAFRIIPSAEATFTPYRRARLRRGGDNGGTAA